MRFFISFFIIGFVLSHTFYGYAQSLDIIYFSPSFNQKVKQSRSDINITFSSAIDTNNLKQNIILFSEFSSNKRYSYRYNDTTNTLSIKPLNPFFIGENVTVIVTKRLKGAKNETFDGFTWDFKIKPEKEIHPFFKYSNTYDEYDGYYLKPLNINNDNLPDVIMAHRDITGNILLTNTDYSISYFQDIPKSPGGIYVSDMDLDYHKEIHTNSLMYIYEQADNQFFYPTSSLNSGQVDLNMDGYPDYVFNWNIPPGDTINYIGIRYNKGNGKLYSKIDTVVIDKNIVILKIADMNNDGIKDIVYVTNIFATPYGTSGANKIVILFFNKNGVNESYTLLNNDLPDDYWLGGFFNLNLADFNQDSYIDVHVVTNVSDYIFINDRQNGVFHDSSNIIFTGGGDLPHDAIPADLNGDGWPDLLSFLTIVPENYTKFYVLLNPCDSSNIFWNDKIIVDENEPAQIGQFFTADFNDDGILDIASAWDDGLHIYFNSFVDNINSQKYNLPNSFTLSQNYPNPFNSSTSIRFKLYKKSLLKIKIFNINGKGVYSFKTKPYQPGLHTLVWKGIDNYGKDVGSGTYFWNFKTETFMKTIKLLLIK